MKAIYHIADLNIEISSVYQYVHLLCSDYRGYGFPSLVVHVTQKDLERERKLSAMEDDRIGRERKEYPDHYLEAIAAYRQIAEQLPEFDGFVFHGSAIAFENKGYVFTAKSGTGKSTHTELWRKLLGKKVCIINDDKPIICFRHEQPFVYGTPWSGKERLNRNIAVPLDAICILDQAETNSIREITKSEALPMLIQQTYRPSDPLVMERTLNLLDQLDIRFYHLGCNMDISAAELSYKVMVQA